MSAVKKKQAGSIILLFMAAIIWGASFVVTKDTLDYIGPLWQMALRFLIAAVPAGVLAVIFRKRWNKRTVISGVILGSIFFLAVLFQNLGMQMASASKSGFLTATYVAFLPFIQLVFLRKKLSGKRILAPIICLAGTALITLSGSLKPEFQDGMLLLCGFMYAWHLVFIDLRQDVDPVMLHISHILTASLLALITALIFEDFPSAINLQCSLGLAYCGIFEVFLGFFFQMLGQRNTNPSLAGIILSMESLFSAIFAVIFLNDVLGPQMIIGGILMILATIINGL